MLSITFERSCLLFSQLRISSCLIYCTIARRSWLAPYSLTLAIKCSKISEKMILLLVLYISSSICPNRATLTKCEAREYQIIAIICNFYRLQTSPTAMCMSVMLLFQSLYINVCWLRVFTPIYILASNGILSGRCDMCIALNVAPW